MRRVHSERARREKERLAGHDRFEKERERERERERPDEGRATSRTEQRAEPTTELTHLEREGGKGIAASSAAVFQSVSQWAGSGRHTRQQTRGAICKFLFVRNPIRRRRPLSTSPSSSPSSSCRSCQPSNERVRTLKPSEAPPPPCPTSLWLERN